MSVKKVLIVCGPTATGKTQLALDLAREFAGELISADSRHVYREMDIVTGKDIPTGFIQQKSRLLWRDQYLPYYEKGDIRIWLTDLINPDEDFSISQWHEAALQTITDIHSRGKLPIVVGGTGFYIQSLLTDLSSISVQPNQRLRDQLKDLTPDQLFNQLSKLDPVKAASLNPSDRANPRRLIRAIEISTNPPSQTQKQPIYQFLQIGLTTEISVLNSRVISRQNDRLKAGALAEVKKLSSKYSYDLPSMTACGYAAFRRPSWESAWLTSEKQYIKKQLTWFKKQSGIQWFDIAKTDWQTQVRNTVASWYNKS